MTLKTEKTRIWYSQHNAVAIVTCDYFLQVGDEIPHEWNEPIYCNLLPELEWCPQYGEIYSGVDGSVLRMDFAIQMAAEAIGEPITGIHEQYHAYLVGGFQPPLENNIINPRVIAVMW